MVILALKILKYGTFGQKTLRMRTKNHDRLPDGSRISETHDGVLVAAPHVIALARTAGLRPREVAQELPVSPPASGLLVCLPDSPAVMLPPGWVGVWVRDEEPSEAGWIPLPPSAAGDSRALIRALHTAETWRRERLRTFVVERDRAMAFKMVNEIGIALSAERDPLRLCEMVLSHARQLVAADAGTLYLVEKQDQRRAQLRFVLAQNDSVEAPWKTSLLPLDPNSVAGAVALRGQIVAVDDVYDLPPESQLRHDRSFDRRFGYRTRSVVGVPMTTYDGEVLGVLQLINHKPRAGIPLADPRTAAEVVPFGSDDVELLCSLASQAAANLVNNRLQEDIKRLFDGFVRGVVTTIEQRDPVTSGHSFRVADGTVALARRLERYKQGRWAGLRLSYEEMRELHYAALLHDVGKVSVREEVLTKPKKLHESELELLKQRFSLARMAHRAQRLEAWLHEALRDPSGLEERLPELYEQLGQELARLDTMLHTVLAANEPSVLAVGNFAPLEAVHRHTIEVDGQSMPLLTDQEVQLLSLACGTLTSEERQEVESHVSRSFAFLSAIPWTRDLARVPELAYGHHEKLDGSGYPRGLAGDDIPLGSRIITVADIFDALTARDRPYKKAVPIDYSLAILENEARQGKLDADLVQLWIESRAWEDIVTS
jgi:HD-GYP domain-containing protein (c-di-GMP phosphodiesterase class II)